MLDPISIYAIGGVLMVYILRLELVNAHRNWVLEYCRDLTIEYADKCKRHALREVKSIPKEEEDAYLEEYKKKLNIVDNIWSLFYKYPSRWNLAFDLTKWSREDMFPYLELNMALALDDKLDEIDYDLIT
jgi:hypothetical protein